MSTKIFLGIMVVVLAIAAYVAYTKVSEDEYEPLGGEGISFICNDATYFMAEFSPSFERVNIMVDGVVERSLARVAGTDLYMYEDASFSYTFAGEEARVTSKSTGTETACAQPFDPNQAPYNFGDLGEGDGGEPDLALAVRGSIEGKWQSTDDENFTREFREGGAAVDGYTGEGDTTGTWQVFAGNTGIETPFPQEEDAVYLKMVMGEMGDEIFYFKVGKLTPEELELVYLDRGGVLSFTYVGDE